MSAPGDLFSMREPAPRIGLGTGIADLDEFNRRAVIAFNGVELERGSWNWQFVRDMGVRVRARRPLTERQQKTLLTLVHRYRRDITDRALTEFAAVRVRGAE